MTPYMENKVDGTRPYFIILEKYRYIDGLWQEEV